MPSLKSTDALFSKYIRHRAILRQHGCERCGKWIRDYLGLECSHYHTRNKKSVRWDIDNAIGLCQDCHQYLEHHPTEHEEWFKRKLGIVLFKLLELRAGRFQKPDLKEQSQRLLKLLREQEALND